MAGYSTTLPNAGEAKLLRLQAMFQDATKLAADQQLAFFQDLDVDDHRNPDGTSAISLYARLFLDPTVPADADLAALQTGAAVADSNITHHLPAIQAALQVSAISLRHEPVSDEPIEAGQPQPTIRLSADELSATQ